ncbi:MAG: hypothetical protein ISP83_03885 [Candidatus Poseidonia sp.]|nr:hypothetical protein [Poseidonia sp.]MBL6748820.1 hypothetical protein [Poseidonia sp.]MBL6806986.1 hypothetical protein [Poseidonia sp.]MBL6886547.1 hypothetical protein [Poseidonia sp.]MBL6892677.1 hypothetical protein [Poseidonia sp.]
MTVRQPADDDELRKAMIAIVTGRSKSIAEVIEEITGEAPTEEQVEAVRNRLHMAQEDGVQLDIAEIIESLNTMADEWA